MKRDSWKAAALPVFLAAMSTTGTAAAGEGLSLRRALLSSGGVGYFEYEAQVHGDADLSLTVPLDQVDDVLKSVVVYDSRGGAGEITLPGKEPSDRAFRDLPFDASALASEPSLLEALRGAEVRVTTQDGTIAGRVLSITEETEARDDASSTVVRHRLALAADGDIRSVILEDARDVAFVDPTLKRQIDAALAAQLADKERGRRTLVVHSAGEGARAVRVGYVVAVPLWKSTYRLTLPANPAAKKANLFGWAVVENQSGADWKDVDLTLVSGNPVTFHQALYASYYVDRPEIPVEVVGRVLPRLDQGAVSIEEKAPAPALPSTVPAPQPGPSSHFRGMGGMGGAFVPGIAGAMPSGAADGTPTPPAETTETATQVVFHLPRPVDVADGQEALLPVIDREVPAERIALYQPDVDARHPLASVELTNDGATGLPPGVVTTYEQRGEGNVTYTGDARLATLPAGEKRVVSFGVDPKVTIDRNAHQARIFDSATIGGGVLRVTRKQQLVTDYTIAGAAHEARTVVLEHPRVADFTLAAPTDLVTGVTERYYRIQVDVPAGATVPVKVVLEHPVAESVVLSMLGAADLAAWAASTELPPAVHEAMAKVAALRQVADEKAATVRDLEAQLASVTTEQARVRDDLKAVPTGGDLAKRYLDLLARQEDQIAAIQAQLDVARQAAKNAEKAVSDAIRSLHL